MEQATAMMRGFIVILSVLMIFVGTLRFMDNLAGPSPGLCQDTIEDQSMMDICLNHGLCPFKGIGTSLGKFRQGLAWHNIRILFGFLGFDIDWVFSLVKLLNVLGMLMLFLTAWRTGGILTACLTMLFSAWVFIHMDFDPWILNNSNIILFLGVLATITGLAAVQSENTYVLMVFSAVLALVADTHVAAAPMVISLVWIAWLATHKWRVVLWSLLTWSVVLFILSPGSWIETFRALVSFVSKSNAAHTISGRILDRPFVLLALFALGISAVMAWENSLKNKGLHALIALILPELMVFIFAGFFMGIDSSDKYLIPIGPAVAMLGASVTVIALSKVLHRLRNPWPIPDWAPVPAAVLTGMVLWLWPITPLTNALPKDPLSVSRLTYRETSKLADLMRSRNWSSQACLANFKAPLYLNLLEAIVPRLKTAESSRFDTGRSGMAIRVKQGVLPEKLPKNWTLVSKNRQTLLYFVEYPRALDWTNFTVCINDSCIKTGLTAEHMKFGPTYNLNGMPMPSKGLHARMTMNIPIICRQSEQRSVYMPGVPGWCSGRVLKITGVSGSISTNGREASYECVRGGKGKLILEWHLGGGQCAAWDYDGFPPFFVEADTRDAILMKRAMLSYPQR